MELELGSYILGLLTLPVVGLLGVGIIRTVEQQIKERQAWESMIADDPKPSAWLMEQMRRASQQESEAEESVIIRQPSKEL